MSTYEIGALVGRDPKRIHEKLKHFGIETRPRGMNLAGKDNYMRQPGVINPFAGKSHSAATREVLSQKATAPRPHLRGAANGMSGRIGVLNPNYKDGSAPERQRLYSSGEWKEIVREVFKRDNYQCVRCSAPKTGRRGLHAHHVEPWAGNAARRFDTTNLVTLCRPCHHWVHSRENVERLWLSGDHSSPALPSSEST